MCNHVFNLRFKNKPFHRRVFKKVFNSYFLIKENKYIIEPNKNVMPFSGYAYMSQCLNIKLLNYDINVQLNLFYKTITKLCQLSKRLSTSHANKVHSEL